jgi:hypothetical protein
MATGLFGSMMARFLPTPLTNLIACYRATKLYAVFGRETTATRELSRAVG